MSEQHKVNCTCDVCTSASNYRPVRVRREAYRQVPVIHRIYPVPIREHLRQGDRVLLRCQPRPHLRAQPRSQALQQPGVNPAPPQPQDEPMEEAIESINELCRTVNIITRVVSGDAAMAEAAAKKPEGGAGEKDDCDSCSNNNTCGPHEMRARPVEPVAGSSMGAAAPQQESSTENETSPEDMVE